MKPGIQKWAENSVYAAGVDVGVANKHEISAGRTADGFERAKNLATGWENMFRWRTSERLDNLAKIRLLNWTEKKDITAVPHTFVTGEVLTGVGVYRPLEAGRYGSYHHVEMHDTSVTLDRLSHTSIGGERYTTTTSTIPTGASAYDIASDGAGGAGIALAGVASGLYSSAAATPLTWTAWAGTAGQSYCAIHHDVARGLWIAYEHGSGDIYSGTTLGAAMTLRQAVGHTTRVACIRASNHPAASLWPQDVGNEVCLYGDAAGNWYRSTDASAATWGALTPSPFAPHPYSHRCLSYSKWGSRWGVICDNGPGTTRPTFAYSDDNGDNWVEIVDAFQWVARGYAAPTGDIVELVSDGWGHWAAIVGINDGSRDVLEVWVSADNGLTWEQAYYPPQSDTILTLECWATLWYGNGSFHVCHFGHDGSVSLLDTMATNRVGD